MQQYLDLLKRILNEGSEHENRTSQDTLRVWGAEIRHDLAKGFPLLTTKKMAYKAAFVELLGFVRGETDIRWYQERGCKIWNADHERWHGPDLERDKARMLDPATPASERVKIAESVKFREENPWSLGEVYGYNWLHLDAGRKPVRFRKPELPGADAHPLDLSPSGPDFPDTGEVTTLHTKDNVSYEYRRTGDQDEQGRPLVCVRFPSTGYTQVMRKDQADRGSVRDRLLPSRVGVGILGYPCEGYDVPFLQKIWSHMIDRCYVESCKEYKSYGEVGITVCPRWHRFDHFVHDVRKLPGFTAWNTSRKDYQLDKDYWGADYYGPTSCVWVPASDNKSYKSSGVIGTDPDGVEHYHVSALQLAEAHNLLSCKISAVIAGERPHHKGWTFRSAASTGELIRYPLPYNQLAEIVKALRAGSNSRRLIMTAWNPARFHMMCLPPCHVQYHFCIDNGKLNIKCDQRSCDTPLGVPFNIANTALLAYLVSHAAGLALGEMVWYGNDVHIYKNQLPGVEEQLKREPKPLPTLKLQTSVGTDPWTTEFEDIKLYDYEPHPKIKFDLTVD